MCSIWYSLLATLAACHCPSARSAITRDAGCWLYVQAWQALACACLNLQHSLMLGAQSGACTPCC